MIQIYSDMYLVDTDVPSLIDKATFVSNSKPLALKGNLLIDYVNGIAMFDCKDCKLFIDCISITECENEIIIFEAYASYEFTSIAPFKK